jgi:DNA-binding MarR family transcriptional regulator
MKTLVVRTSAEAQDQKGEDTETVLVIDEAIGVLVAVTSRLMDRIFNARLSRHNVSFGQWPILMNLWAEEGISQRELSRRVSIDEGTTTRTLDRMASEGLVVRKNDKNDRRQHNIYLTAKGRNLRDSLVPLALASNDQAISTLSPREVEALRKILGKMIASLKKGLDPG